MMDRGVSAIVGSCSRALVPSVMRAVGYRVVAEGAEVMVYLARSQSRQLLQDVADTGRVSVVFSEPFSHVTVQLKSARARVVPIPSQVEAELARYRLAMEHEVGKVGFPPTFVQAMLRHDMDDLVAVHLLTDVAFDQTPGPHAGQVIGRANGAEP